jgi:hypothetical protein
MKRGDRVFLIRKLSDGAHRIEEAEFWHQLSPDSGCGLGETVVNVDPDGPNPMLVPVAPAKVHASRESAEARLLELIRPSEPA